MGIYASEEDDQDFKEKQCVNQTNDKDFKEKQCVNQTNDNNQFFKKIENMFENKFKQLRNELSFQFDEKISTKLEQWRIQNTNHEDFKKQMDNRYTQLEKNFNDLFTSNNHCEQFFIGDKKQNSDIVFKDFEDIFNLDEKFVTTGSQTIASVTSSSCQTLRSETEHASIQVTSIGGTLPRAKQQRQSAGVTSSEKSQSSTGGTSSSRHYIL